jgi:hypothetical protein
MAVHSAPTSLFVASSTCGALQRRCRASLTPISPRRLRYQVREYACFVCDASLISTGTFPQPQKRDRFKRSRSVSRGQNISDGDQDNEDGSEIMHSFYIGNTDGLIKFFQRRLDELTTKPLRPIVTAWIKQLEPKRLSRYGRYHKKLSRDQPSGCTPPWWPHNVPYLEPSHLEKAGKSYLTVTTLVTYLTFCRPLNVSSGSYAPAPPN